MGSFVRKSLGAVAVLLPLTSASLSGQAEEVEPRGFVNISFITATPQGDFANNVGQGFGVQVGARFQPDRQGLVSLRADFGFISYGRERLTFCSTFSCRLAFDMITTNNIFFAGVGPEVRLATGALQPYVSAGLGVGYFWTQTDLGGSDSFGDFARTENFNDAVLQWRAGGGLRARVKRGHRPIYLDLGAEYHGNGIAEYLREGDILDNPDGSITIFPNKSEANLVTFRVGVSIGVGKERKHRR